MTDLKCVETNQLNEAGEIIDKIFTITEEFNTKKVIIKSGTEIDKEKLEIQQEISALQKKVDYFNMIKADPATLIKTNSMTAKELYTLLLPYVEGRSVITGSELEAIGVEHNLI